MVQTFECDIKATFRSMFGPKYLKTQKYSAIVSLHYTPFFHATMFSRASSGASFEMDLKQLWSEMDRTEMEVYRPPKGTYPDLKGYQVSSKPLFHAKRTAASRGIFRSRPDTVGVTRDCTLTISILGEVDIDLPGETFVETPFRLQRVLPRIR